MLGVADTVMLAFAAAARATVLSCLLPCLAQEPLLAEQVHGVALGALEARLL